MDTLIIIAAVLGYVAGWLTTAWIIAPAIVDTDRWSLQPEAVLGCWSPAQGGDPVTAESPTDLIRRAAERLREDVPPGDLATCGCGEHIDVHTDDGCLRCACDLSRQGVVAQAVAKHSVDPTVVADLLDGIAKWRLPCDPPCWERGISGCPDCETVDPALRVARSILRETGESDG